MYSTVVYVVAESVELMMLLNLRTGAWAIRTLTRVRRWTFPSK